MSNLDLFKAAALMYLTFRHVQQGQQSFHTLNAYQVGPPQPPTFLPRIGIQVGAMVRGGVLHVLLLTILDVPHNHQRRTGDEDELQRPQADVGDGEDVVIAHVAAARLGRVADKVFVVVPPHSLGCHHKHHYPEDENHGQPDTAKHSGVLVNPTEECLQCRPVHRCCLRVGGGDGGSGMRLENWRPGRMRFLMFSL